MTPRQLYIANAARIVVATCVDLTPETVAADLAKRPMLGTSCGDPSLSPTPRIVSAVVSRARLMVAADKRAEARAAAQAKP